MDFYGQVVAVECKLCGEVGLDIESCRLRDRFPEFCRKHARKSTSYGLEPTSTFRDSYSPEPNYKPDNNSHNQDMTHYQDSSLTYNEDNSFEQPRSCEDDHKSCLAIVEQQGNLEEERNKMIKMNEELIAFINEPSEWHIHHDQTINPSLSPLSHTNIRCRRRHESPITAYLEIFAGHRPPKSSQGTICLIALGVEQLQFDLSRFSILGQTVGFKRLGLVVSRPPIDFLETSRVAVVQGTRGSLNDSVGHRCGSLLDRLVYVGSGFKIVVAPYNHWKQRGDEFSRKPSDFALEGDEDERSIEPISRM
ncbi:hypothetical protein LWI28_002694 [Acer negundo]|uniref:Uncharacterized protein n=1 Tax=Acer negundo TaxID=4023 RepID=A0AAD5NJG7_ACENE|nr:hypothetical protein LWI28_002694 [Acer negundo]